MDRFTRTLREARSTIDKASELLAQDDEHTLAYRMAQEHAKLHGYKFDPTTLPKGAK